MVKVRITSGAFGYKHEGATSVELIPRGHTCMVTEDQASRLIRLGAAEIVEEKKAEEPKAEPKEKAVKKAVKTKKDVDKAPDLTVEDPV